MTNPQFDTEADKLARLFEEFGEEWAEEAEETPEEALETASIASTLPKKFGTRPAVFLDRDGTLNVEINYLHRIEDFVWIKGAPEAIKWLNTQGYVVVVVTNQAGIGHGYYQEKDVERLHAFMQGELDKIGARIDAFYYSPYHPAAQRPEYRADHPSRKPQAGMYEAALRDLDLDPKQSIAIGDKNTDLIPAHGLGMMTMLVLTGYGPTEKRETSANFVVQDIADAVWHIDMFITARNRGFDTDIWEDA